MGLQVTSPNCTTTGIAIPLKALKEAFGVKQLFIVLMKTVTVGRIRPCPLLDFRMVMASHKTLRGAASGSLLNAELLAWKGFLS